MNFSYPTTKTEDFHMGGQVPTCHE